LLRVAQSATIAEIMEQRAQLRRLNLLEIFLGKVDQCLLTSHEWTRWFAIEIEPEMFHTMGISGSFVNYLKERSIQVLMLGDRATERSG
jgi:hypothetical protein